MAPPYPQLTTSEKVQKFAAGPVAADLSAFIALLGKSIQGCKGLGYNVTNPVLKGYMALLNDIRGLCQATPPVDDPKHQRYGNLAYRDFMGKVEAALPRLMDRHLRNHLIELKKIRLNDYQAMEDSHADCSTNVSNPPVADLPVADSNVSNPPVADLPVSDLPVSDPPERLDEWAATVMEELSVYWLRSLGNPIRLDYGSGHELNFICALFILYQEDLVLQDLGEEEESVGERSSESCSSEACKSTDDLTKAARGRRSSQLLKSNELLRAAECPVARSLGISEEILKTSHKHEGCQIVLGVFMRYLELVRQIQIQYQLEPAGSRGVWGLDDHQFIPFLWGSYQLKNNADLLTPADIVKPEYAKSSLADSYLYINCIRHIMNVKSTAPFHETSPLLYDISATKTWDKLLKGFTLMFLKDILSTFTIIQHLPCGKYIHP
ncbi:putative phosphotyrosyl phosphatase activator [Gregarina niphandrodes]|uniref:Serine/threonine-protein phosphatase 2A activator n=1 Tax=Gregarina niphandrodes TaxID=110365 RepID=A0A023B1E9_GRENI|nr:putative phosphotyrosyl phosphatase activator [Gregarina niphandrodes]EZG46764.1 putative phosphotyrosyl phosphatase activator [Gregarina niphandrodes]|eukprot:XP_011132273.1 putative phosphotyrosyl phosphatase activator [Gregarina niphandrodes]